LLALASGQTPASDPATVGLMIAIMALRREESRGAHSRTDFPQSHAIARRTTLRLTEAIAAAEEIDGHGLPMARRA
jgi:L-aspartate oxidase